MFDNLLRFKKNTKYAVLDFESYNLALHFAFNKPWQVAVIQTKGFEVLNCTELIINWLNEHPNVLVEPEVAIKTHYDKQKVIKLGLVPNEAFNIFYPMLVKADYILAQNIWGFDIYLLKHYCVYMNKPWKDLIPKIIDTNAIGKGIKSGNIFDPKKENFIEYQQRMNNFRMKGLKTNLKALCKDYEIEYIDELAHSASYDCNKTLEVWKKMVWNVEF
jgi:Exonuclease